MLVEVEGASFGYAGRAVVEAPSVRLRAGGCLGIFGPNGSGKTTLVRGITGLLRPLTGVVRHPTGARPRVGYLPQHRSMSSHWPMTATDAAALAPSAHARFGWLWSPMAMVKPWFERLSVLPLADQPFATLSGGQQQRVLLAGALAAEPRLLVLDEPTEGLDVASRRVVLDALNERRAAGLCVVVISHDVEDLLRLAEEIAWLHPGEVAGAPSRVEVVTPNELLSRVALARRQ